MSRFILHYINELTPEERKRLGLGRYEDDGSILEDTATGKTYRDGWEPEDATFTRDLGWVPALLDELSEEIDTLKARLAAAEQAPGLPYEVQALARFYSVVTDQEFWRCLACGGEWPSNVVTACANCHGPKETP